MTSRRNWQEARSAGVIFYELPDELNYEQVDPLIQWICRRINASGWVATGESCQGHPDATERHPWGAATDPYLRLCVHTTDAGRMLDLLMAATRIEEEFGLTFHMSVSLHEHGRSSKDVNGEWRQFYVRVRAATVYDRNCGLKVLLQFAESLEIRG